jgi:hypothetical protein
MRSERLSNAGDTNTGKIRLPTPNRIRGRTPTMPCWAFFIGENTPKNKGFFAAEKKSLNILVFYWIYSLLDCINIDRRIKNRRKAQPKETKMTNEKTTKVQVDTAEIGTTGYCARCGCIAVLRRNQETGGLYWSYLCDQEEHGTDGLPLVDCGCND